MYVCIRRREKRNQQTKTFLLIPSPFLSLFIPFHPFSSPSSLSLLALNSKTNNQATNQLIFFIFFFGPKNARKL